jgi:hypothetical protein
VDFAEEGVAVSFAKKKAGSPFSGSAPAPLLRSHFPAPGKSGLA